MTNIINLFLAISSILAKILQSIKRDTTVAMLPLRNTKVTKHLLTIEFTAKSDFTILNFYFSPNLTHIQLMINRELHYNSHTVKDQQRITLELTYS